MKKYNSRSEVEEKYKWDLSEYFKNEKEFDDCYNKSEKAIDEISKYIGCTKDSDKLYEYLEKSVTLAIDIMNLYGYAMLVNDQELGNSKSIERLNNVISLNAKNNSDNSFFEPELLKLNSEEYSNLFKNSKLKEYKPYLDLLYRNREHILTDNEEKIVSELTSSMNHFSDISSTLLNSEHKYGNVVIDGEDVEIASNNFSYLIKNKNKNIRYEVYNKFYKVIEQYSNTCASLLNSYVSMNDTVAKIHKFDNSWEEKLFSINLSDKVYQSLVNSAEDNLEPLHKYYRLRKEILGLDELHSYDLAVKLSDNDKEYSIEDAWNITSNALKCLGKDYTSRYNKVIKDRHIDYCQYKGKCSGGYNLSTYDKNSKILLSFNGDLDSVSTIIHEGGHHINHQCMQEANKPIYCENSTIVAEVASLTNEFLLSNYLLENSSENSEKLAGLESIIDVFCSNFYGAVREGKMEQEMYHHVSTGSSITKDYMDKLTTSSLKKYYGDEVVLDDYSKCSWVKRSHYYMHFYLYSYAISASVAVNCAKKVLDGDQEFIDKYKKFLSLGLDVWPMDAYKVLGFDLEDENIFIDAIKYFDSLIDKYHKLITER